MSRRRYVAPLVLVLCLTLVVGGCVGPFNLTGQVLDWNRTLSDEPWIQEVVFLAFVILPVYGITILLDGIVFNSVEFWTGDNLINPPG